MIGFLSGELGDPPGGWPEPFRTKALAGRTVKHAQDGADRRTSARGSRPTAAPTLNRLLFPGPTKEFADSRETYSDLSVLPTRDFLYGLRAGERARRRPRARASPLLLGVEAISEPDERGFRTVMCTINGQLRPVSVRDRSVAADAPAAEKADPARPGPGRGAVRRRRHARVAEGDEVEAGDVVATIEAMKMEASITAPVAGTVERVALDGTQPSRAATSSSSSDLSPPFPDTPQRIDRFRQLKSRECVWEYAGIVPDVWAPVRRDPGPDVGTSRTGQEKVNQVERRPRVERNESPLTLMLVALPDLVPTSFIDQTRPFHWPFPSRVTTLIDFRLPTPGQAFSIRATSTLSDQSWTGLPDQPSYGSAFAGR